MTTLNAEDRRFLDVALKEARKGFDEGGIPVGAVMAEEGEVLSRGRNRRLQESNPIAHGEMDCIRHAGRRTSYRGITLYTTLSPCMMCAGTIVQFGIGRVVIGESENFPGNIAFLRERGVEVVEADDPECKSLLRRFIADNPQLWNEDIAED